MVVGFNHNFRYKGVLYHVQTEDGGIKNPAIITHLFTGGTILSSRKTSYADILKSDRLEPVVEELMKEQHREMLRQLRDGELDETIATRMAAASLSAAVARPAATSGGKPVVEVSKPPAPEVIAPPAPSREASLRRPPLPATQPPRPTAVATPLVSAASRVATASVPPVPVIPKPEPPRPVVEITAEPARENSLDDIILSYLLGEGGKKP